MWLHVLFLLVGGALLYFGAEWLVRGSAGLARAMGIRPLVIGLTVVALGTSAPELVVTLLAAHEGKSAIALGNIVGSNIANLGFILAVTALICPPRVSSKLIQSEVPAMLMAAAAIPLTLADGVISRAEGLCLLAAAVVFTGWMLKSSETLPPVSPELVARSAEVDATAGRGSRLALVGWSVLGLALLVAGGKLFVDGASAIALGLGMSERVVGLTIVALGTSLPELATSVVAALRKHSDIAIGNIVGSNIHNVLLILGTSSVVRPIEGSLAAMQVDLLALGILTAMGAVFLRSDRFVTRPEAMALLVTYAAFLGLLATG